MVLGKDVYDARGGLVGSVVDVGVHDWRRVKFLLIEEPLEGFTRLNVDRIDSVQDRGVFLKPLRA